MKIKFLTLELDNYRKLDHFYLALENRGIVRIEGHNGSGKSSIFEGLTWVLFGIDSRKSNIKSIIRFGETTVTGIVQLEIKDTRYRIVRERTASSTNVTIFKDDEELKFNTSKDAQTYLDSIINIDANTFYHLVFLRQYNVESFFELTDSYQKSFLDTIFDFSIFNSIYDHYDTTIKKISKLEDEFSQVYNWLESEKQTLEEENIRLNSLKVENIDTAQYDDTIEELEGSIKETEKTLTELTKEKTVLEKEVPNRKDVIKELELSIKQFKEKENFFPEKVDLYRASLEEGKCIVCNRKLSQTLEKQFTSILTELDSLHTDLKNMNNNLDKERVEYDNLNSQLHDLTDKMRGLQYSKDSFEAKIKNIHATIEQNIKQAENTKQLIQSRNDIIEANTARILTISETIDHDFWKAVATYRNNLEKIRELFGKKGLKNNFLDVYTVALASNINGILEEILPDTKVEIATEKQLTTGDIKRSIDVRIIKEGNSLGYFDLSGGERKRLDLAFILATHALLEDLGDFSSNILVLDEAFDGLDAEGMEEFSNYLRGYEKNSIFVITHTPYTTYADNLIVMGEDNG
ncbi:MAG TPA: AAA family ATPase [Bacilli bacterium]|mgnify:CR=1 FL=1|nr:AAA family ATPase [Bacilli bacterium]